MPMVSEVVVDVRSWLVRTVRVTPPVPLVRGLTAMVRPAQTLGSVSGSASSKLIDAVAPPLIERYALAVTFAATFTVPLAVCCG
jgi:hypothetical protein